MQWFASNRRSVRDLEQEENQDIVENIVASWVYSASQQILDETSSMFVLTSGPAEPSFSSVLEDEESAYPARSSSLSPDLKASAVDEAQALFDRLKGREGNQNRSGRDFLASQRAQLVVLQRTTLKHTASRYGYQIGWSEKLSQEHGSSALSDVDLSDEDDPSEKRQSIQMLPKKLLDGIYCDSLMRAVVSQRELKSSFEVSKNPERDQF
jgi:trafficking protein particle complex subunit 10